MADNERVERLILIAPALPAAVPPPTRWTPRRIWGGVWRRAAPRARMRRIPGAHLSAITTHVAELTQQMRACLHGED